MKRSHRARLRDIIDNIDAVRDILNGADFVAYRADLTMRRAVERCLEIISEASRFIDTDGKARHPEIAWSDIAGIGNLLRHEYQRIDDHIIWSAATRSLPELHRAVTALLLSDPD